MTDLLRQLLEMRQAVPLSWSPDGSRLLVASNLPGTHQLYEWPSLRQLTSYDEPVTGQFLPDGRVLVEVDEGGNERTQLHVVGEGALVADARFIHRSPHARGRLLAYATNRRNGVDFDVVARDLETGEEQVFELEGNNGVAAVSPDGRSIVVERVGARSGDNDLLLCDLGSGEVSLLTPHEEAAEFLSPVWTPEGWAWATNAGRDTFAVVRGGETLFESEWDVDLAGDESGRLLLALENADGYARLHLVGGNAAGEAGVAPGPGVGGSAADAASLGVPLPGRGVVEHPVFSPDGARLAFAFSSPVEPHDVYVYDLGSRRLERLTTSPRAVEPSALVEPTLHRFESFDGESVPVFLFEPEGDGPFPVVVTVHGGPEAQWLPWFSPSFAPLTQYLVSRGYAVAAPNVRGSSGYGKRYEHLDDIELRLDSVRDLASLHAWLAARPEIDGSRAAVYGRSYGGYMVLAALAFQPELWAAGIEAVGIASLVTFLENTSPYRRAAREREYGSLARDREFLERASPLAHVDAIRAPLFIQHGRNDPRVPVTESEQIAAVLRENGVECELLIFEDEGHTVEKLPNRIETFERAVAFLERVL
ncbi:MAG TPA: LpqB family beta-propeller domain-containing protein [Gaiellaceae bacterium]|nr:LpqB family beta-propeller domain-containing protein [Gaiellaceae bacterium]